MFIRTLVRFSIPFSLVYCSCYQDIWREGDERLFEQQRQSWRKFFNLLDNSYRKVLFKLNIEEEPSKEVKSLISKFESLDVKKCWNSKVIGAFSIVDQTVSNPMATGCRLYRKTVHLLSNETKQTQN